MEFRQLKSFHALGKELDFARAAARLEVSKLRLGQDIQRLERKLGVSLFDSESNELRLTPAGNNLLAQTAELLAEMRKVQGKFEGGRQSFDDLGDRLMYDPAAHCRCPLCKSDRITLKRAFLERDDGRIARDSEFTPLDILAFVLGLVVGIVPGFVYLIARARNLDKWADACANRWVYQCFSCGKTWKVGTAGGRNNPIHQMGPLSGGSAENNDPRNRMAPRLGAEGHCFEEVHQN